jgi:hypothetical protein
MKRRTRRRRRRRSISYDNFLFVGWVVSGITQTNSCTFVGRQTKYLWGVTYFFVFQINHRYSFVKQMTRVKTPDSM